MLNFIILAILSVPSILAALSSKEMASALITAEDTGTLEEIFKKYEEEQDVVELSFALGAVAKQGHHAIVASCFRMAHDPFPADKMCMSQLVYWTLFRITSATNTESFTKMVTSLKPNDAKPLLSIRYWTLYRNDVVDVLKRVMKKSPELITDDLPSWLAFHDFDRCSKYYSSFHEKAFKYLTSFATQNVLAKALTIVEKNEHYKVDSQVACCSNRDHFHHDLIGKISDLLGLVKARNALTKETLAFLPSVLVDLMLEYTTCDIPPNRSISNLEKTVRAQCLIS